jgi:ATP-dependent Clp endopeptidase proteolytic subunit ClpP
MNKSEGVVKMYLYGDIGDDFFGGISAKNVQEQLSNVDAEEIEIHLNSYGGDVFESIAIHNLLKQKDAKITVFIDGIAASGGSVIAMAGDTIKMPKNTEMMIHNPWTVAFGNAKELRTIAGELDKHEEILEESYMHRFNGSLEDLQTLLGEETYLTASEAVSYGLADEVVSDETDEEPEETDEDTIDEIAARVAAKLEPIEETPEEKPVNNIYKLFIKEGEK